MNNERNDFKMLMLEIKKVKKYDHVPGKNESWKFSNLESNYDRYLAHRLDHPFYFPIPPDDPNPFFYSKT